MNKIFSSLFSFDHKDIKIALFVSAFTLLLLSLTLIGLSFDNDKVISLCFINLVVIFGFGVFYTYKVLKTNTYNDLIPFLFLNWFVGCFSANMFINVFENLPIWVYLCTFLFCFTNFIIYVKINNNFISKLAFLLNGITFALIAYYVIYLIPILPFSFIGMLGLGMGFYGLVPLIVMGYHIVFLCKNYNQIKQESLYFISGLLSIMSGIAFFAYQLNNESLKMNQFQVTKTFETDDHLPHYIKLSQNLTPNFWNEILLKKDVVYIGYEKFFNLDGFRDFDSKQYNERKTHNPLVNLGYLLATPIEMPVADKIAILKANFDKRLETETHLWDGKDLMTQNIKEDIKIFPAERIAYTELTLDVVSTKNSRTDQEAIYSFQLPEGAVATSLSLWVNGVERKGVLTTKEKAQKAYNQVVGVEYRDPSLMQWREGNRIVVRVFPVNNQLPRTFKCGFTTPLTFENQKVRYQNIQVQGPHIAHAATLSRLQIADNSSFEATKNFELQNGYLTHEGTGLQDWQLEVAVAKNFESHTFNWKNKSYQTAPIQAVQYPFVPSEIILDLNQQWTIYEIEQFVNQEDKKFFVFLNQEKIAITKQNYKNIFARFETLNYSLLPLYHCSNNSLIVTKSNTFSANFEELANTKYLTKIKTKTKPKGIKVLVFSKTLNPFWQTIKEQKYADVLQTNLQHATQLVAKKAFEGYPLQPHTVAVLPAQMAITETTSNPHLPSTGSDHLYRLFAFNQILNEQVAIQADSTLQNRYVYLAKETNIVSPISSLIVLETDEDYENNGIEKNVNTLGNASINNHGAVPEPHEWALLGIMFIVFGIYYNKNKQTTY